MNEGVSQQIGEDDQNNLKLKMLYVAYEKTISEDVQLAINFLTDHQHLLLHTVRFFKYNLYHFDRESGQWWEDSHRVSS